VIREFSIAVPSDSIVTRANGLHEEIKVENVPAAKPVHTGRKLSYIPGHAVINLERTNQVKELETHRAKVSDLTGHDGKHEETIQRKIRFISTIATKEFALYENRQLTILK